MIKHVKAMSVGHVGVGAFALQSVNLSLIPLCIQTFTLKTVFTASLLDVQHETASLLVVSLSKTLNGTFSPLCGRQVAYPYFTGLQL